MTDQTFYEAIEKECNLALANTNPMGATHEVLKMALDATQKWYIKYTQKNFILPDSVLDHYSILNPTEEQQFNALEVLMDMRVPHIKDATKYVFRNDNHWTAILAVLIFLGKLKEKKEGERGMYKDFTTLVDSLYLKYKNGEQPRREFTRTNLQETVKKIGLNLHEWEYKKASDAYKAFWNIAYQFLLILEKVIQTDTDAKQRTEQLIL